MAARFKKTLGKEERGELEAMTRSGKIPAKGSFVTLREPKGVRERLRHTTFGGTGPLR
ncbi:MAG: hypothetical protein ACPGSB_06160 [Opitutales bacterium]